ncbi:GTP-binding protein Era [Nitzschia inconspicua]|uniref:GTP-binding protein Era n=1 Tax=Nitzschia inconspicua TaxID=303405 RepID=A0A9K3M598_9STRA|nr:GTP-binding protein Era [Nitzschia inconspicua]
MQQFVPQFSSHHHIRSLQSFAPCELLVKRQMSSIIPTSPRDDAARQARIRETRSHQSPSEFRDDGQPSVQQQQQQQQQQHQLRTRLDVAIVGAPNAGKSQLLNVLTQSPVAAVSRKRHTTRSDILGARTIDNTQLVFKDTPGFLRLENAKEERLDRDLIATAAAELEDVDFTLLVVDAARTLTDNYRQALVQLMIGALNSRGRIEEEDDDDDDDDTILDEEGKKYRNNSSNISPRHISNGPKFAIVLNKTDLVHPKSSLLDLAMDVGNMADLCLKDQFDNDLKRSLDFDAKMELSPIVFYISALKEEGIDDILDHLTSLATPCRSWAVPPGESTNLTPLEQVQEIIREKIYRSCHREVPHSVRQINRLFRKVESGLVIHQDLVVFTKSHQRLVQGTGGRTLQRIQESAQKDLEKVFGCSVALQLHVKLTKSKNRLDTMGGDDVFRSSEQISQTVVP